MLLKRDLLLIIPWILLELTGTDSDSLIAELTEETNIDKFISDYIDEVERTLKPDSTGHVIKKRSADIDIYQLQGVDLFVGFQEEFSLPVIFPSDLILFSHCSSGTMDDQTWYASALEANLNAPNIALANDLILFKYEHGLWVEKDRTSIFGGMRLAAEQIGDIIYIIVAENHAVAGRGSPRLYLIDHVTDTFQFVHMLDNHYVSNVIMWKWEDMEAFAAVAVSENGPDSEKRYSTLSPVYHWEGGSHWNMIGTLPTNNPRALTQFTIGSSMFIAVANFQNDLGETAVDSEIFRFDLPSNKISLYQKLPTEAALDIKYFCFQGPRSTDRFLVYASAYHTDEEGQRDFAAPSVVYKFSDEGYFVPFQALRVPRITSWQPVRYIKDKQESLTLLAAMEEGIASFQYDGWRFMSTGVTYDRTSFGPGAKIVNVFYYGDQTLISVANKESRGYEANVFRPVLKHDSTVQDVQQEFLAWEQRVSQQLATEGSLMASLLQIAQRAPSTEDSVIKLGSKVTFMDAQIDNVETSRTKVGENDVNNQVAHQLFHLNSQLESVQRALKTVKAIIDKTTFPELTVYEDITQPKADIECVTVCNVEQLLVSEVNGENFPEFQANTVNINEPIEFSDSVTFDKLALTDPLVASRINGHSAHFLVDWSTDVHLKNGLQVDGEVILKKDLSVGGLLDGVAINLKAITKEEATGQKVIVLPTQFFNTINISELTLSDGILSGQDFIHFQERTLKTHGNQFVSEFQDFERVEADEVTARHGKAGVDIPPSPFYVDCDDGKPCEGNADDNIVKRTSARSDDQIEAISFIDNEITITKNFTIYGSVIINNGSLVAKELIDLKHNISANKLMEHGISLEQPVVNSHVHFHSGFKAANLNVDSVNGVNMTSLVDPESTVPVVVTARKEFRGGFTVEGGVDVKGTVNGVNISEFFETLSQSSEVHFDNLTLQSVNSSNIEVSGDDWNHVLRKTEDGTLLVDSLMVEGPVVVKSLHLQGPINDLYLDDLLEDTVYSDENLYVITGKKHFTNELNISNITLNGTMNGIDANTIHPEYLWKKRLSQPMEIKVDRLTYSGKLDGIEARDFGEWMMTEGDQTIMGSQTINSLSTINADTHIINSVDIHKLVDEAVFIYDNATLNHPIFQNGVESPGLVINGRLQGLKVPDDLVVSDTDVSQQVLALKNISGDVTIHGDLWPAGNITGYNITGLCQLLRNNNTNVVITGSAVFEEEPNVSTSINNKTWVDLMENIWLKEDNVVINSITQIHSAEFNNLVAESINNKNVEHHLSRMVSLTKDEELNGTFFLPNVSMRRGLEAGEVTVGGNVQGLRIQRFIRDVMLDGEDQEITGIPDFNHLIVDGGLETDGLINSLNLSEDVMLNNVPNNTVTAAMSLNSLSVKKLTVPRTTHVGGVDVLRWNNTAVKKSGRGVITGNIVFHGQFDAPRGIRIHGLVNNMTFDKKHVMLMHTPQQITGSKTFSPQSKLTIQNLTVGGFLNGMNITEFYNHQVKMSGNAILSGAKTFSSPLYSRKAVVPEMFQGYNLSWLDHQLSVSPPRAQYQAQLAALGDIQRQAELSLAGQAYYLKNVSRIGEIKRTVLSVFPLKSHNSSALGLVSVVDNKAVLSLLHWSDEYNMFRESVVHLLKATPQSVQSVSLPGDKAAVYITRYIPYNKTHPAKYGEILLLGNNWKLRQNKIIDGEPNSKLLSFQYSTNRTCFIVVADICRVYCPIGETRRIRLSSFACQNVSEMSVLGTEQAVYLVGLQSGTLVVWRLQGKRFVVVQSKAQFNPVSVSATVASARGPLIAVANSHRIGNSRPETIDVYRLNKESSELSLEQQLPTIAPRQILFAKLPTRESVLYVTSNNQATPLEVFVYRGILGYVPFTVERTLALPTDISTLTDHKHRHFVLLKSEDIAQILQAQVQGGL